MYHSLYSSYYRYTNTWVCYHTYWGFIFFLLQSPGSLPQNFHQQLVMPINSQLSSAITNYCDVPLDPPKVTENNHDDKPYCQLKLDWSEQIPQSKSFENICKDDGRCLF